MNRLIHPYWGALALLSALFCGFVRPSFANVVYVNQNAPGAVHDGRTWATGFTSVQPGVDAAHPGDEVWVAAGTYGEHVDIGAGQSLYGGFAGNETRRDQRDWKANPTVLDGGSTDYVVLVHTQNPELDGFTVRNGSTAISVNNCRSATVARCAISGISYGVALEGSEATGAVNGTVTIADCTVAAYGDAVKVYSGTTTIKSCEISDTLVDGDGVSDESGDPITLIDCQIIRNQGRGLYFTASTQATVTGCTISSNRWDGVRLESGAGATLTNCTISGNSGAGVNALTDGPVFLVDCTISGNEVGASLYTYYATLRNCVVASNYTGGVYCPNSDTPLPLSHNDVFGNALGNYINVKDPTGIDGNISQDPKLSNSYHDVHLEPGSPCIDAGDDTVIAPGETDVYRKPRIIGAHVDIGSDESDGKAWLVQSRIWYVAQLGKYGNDGRSWATAKGAMYDALAVAEGGDEVWVAKGTYPSIVNVPLGVALYGGFTGSETKRSQRDWGKNITVIQDSVNAVEPGAVVDGFTSRTRRYVNITAGIGAVIENCTIFGTSTLSGTGIEVRVGRVGVRNCTLCGGFGGTRIDYGGNASFSNCSFSGSRISAGFVDSFGSASFDNCTITGCGAGIGINVNGATTMTNCVVASNSYGIVGSSRARVITLSHNDVYGNAKGNYVYIKDPTGSNGNISADPLFVNWLGGDYHLRLRSPCIDTGDDSVITPGETDLDGGPRIQHAQVDMGCYEFPGVVRNVAPHSIRGARG